MSEDEVREMIAACRFMPGAEVVRITHPVELKTVRIIPGDHFTGIDELVFAYVLAAIIQALPVVTVVIRVPPEFSV